MITNDYMTAALSAAFVLLALAGLWALWYRVTCARLRSTITRRRTPFITAAFEGDLDTVARLLEAGADPNEAELDPWMPGNYGAQGPLPSSNSEGNTAGSVLMIAAKSGHLEVARALIAAGANVNFRSGIGATPLGCAIDAQALPIVRLLISAGADPNGPTTFGYTPMIDASEGANVEIVKELLSAGANPNTQSSDGLSPLMSAVLTGRDENLRELLAAGSNPRLKDATGKTALDIARQKRRRSMIRMLEDAA